MHYVGNLGVRNYHLLYSDNYILASILIAVGDCLAVLILFYQLREQWINLWWRRFLCAVLLAGGISVCHLLSSVMLRKELTCYHCHPVHALRRVYQLPIRVQEVRWS